MKIQKMTLSDLVAWQGIYEHSLREASQRAARAVADNVEGAEKLVEENARVKNNVIPKLNVIIAEILRREKLIEWPVKKEEK